MSRGKKAARKVVSGLSTAGSGSRGGAGRAPLRAQPSFALGPPPPLAVPERRPGPIRSHISASVGLVSPPAVNRVSLK